MFDEMVESEVGFIIEKLASIETVYGKQVGIEDQLKEKEKENLITDLINVIKADDDIHKHEYFLLGHIGNCIGLDSKKIVNIIELENKGSKKSTGWLAWLFG